MKNSLTFLLFVVLSLTVYGQKQGNIWYFGDHAGLDFNSGSPTAITNGQTYFISSGGLHNEGSSVICDSSGSLLFYSNGRKVWNRNQSVMPYGDNLLGHPSSTQGALIVPQPLSDRYFYLFTTDAFVDDYLQYGIRYSVIDMCLDNGFGDIVSTSKNTLLLDTVAEKLAAVKHSNGTDYWIVTHKYWSDAFYSFRLTSNGIVDTVVSHIGSIHQNIWNLTSTSSAIGQLKISPDGSKLALCFSNCNPGVSELFDFSASTGIVSNFISLPADSMSGNLYGVEFSPDNSKLYFTGGYSGLYQFDLTAGGGNADSIKNSKTLIAQPNSYLFGLQLAPDGKINIAIFQQPYVDVINNPNAYGSACNFSAVPISLNNKMCSYGLPAFITNYNYSNNSVACPTGISENSVENLVTVFPNPSNNILNIQNNSTQSFRFTLYNSLGVKLIDKILTNKTNTINLSAYSNDIYFYKLNNDKQVIKSGKLIKQ